MTSLKARRKQFLSDPNKQCLNNWIGPGLCFLSSSPAVNVSGGLRQGAALCDTCARQSRCDVNIFHRTNMRIYWMHFLLVLYMQMCPSLIAWLESPPAPATTLFAFSLAFSLSLAVFSELQLWPPESRPAAERLQLQHAGEWQRFVPSCSDRQRPRDSVWCSAPARADR